MEKETPPTVTKICSSCGQQKPLSAFLELSGENAGTYGNICGNCRKSNQQKVAPKDAEGSARTDTGHKIDSKAKIASDITNKALEHREEEEYHEERDENEIITTDELDKRDTKSKDERKHRETFLDRRSFLSDKRNADAKAPKTHLATQAEALDTKNEADNLRDEQKKSEFDFTGPVVDTQIAGKVKFSGVAIRQFATWVGKSSAVGRSLGQKQPTTAEKNKDATLSEHIEKTWGPSSKR